jgi:hypothetical protein
MSLAREFGQNGLVTSLASRQRGPSRQENAHDLLQELNKDIRGATFEADLLSVRDSVTDIPSNVSVMTDTLNGDLAQIQSEPEKIVQKVKQTTKEHRSEKRGFIERPIGWVAVRSISFRSIKSPIVESDGLIC